MSKREELRERRRRREQRSKFIWIGLAVIIGLGLLAAFVLPPVLAMQDVERPADNPRPQAQGLSTGDPNAPVKVVEFSDFQCPICKEYSDTVEKTIVNDYISTGKVYFTYTPLAFIGAESVAAAKASYCASEQNKFWEYHDILFANQKAENAGDFTETKLDAFARALGLKRSDFRACVASGKYDDALQENDNLARDSLISGTPAFLVNSKMVGDYRTLVDEINKALAMPQ